jgi:glycosyltransferase involved in cell wall biosynthesis
MSTLSICTICQDESEVIEEFLNCCVYTKAVLQQDLKEVVIVDGGSKDNTLGIIKRYGEEIPLVLIENLFDTFGKQKNRALEKVTGDYIFFPDADMSWTKNFAEVFKAGYYDRAPMWDFHMFFTAKDKYHYFRNWPRGVNMRLWRRGPIFATEFHEKLQGQHSGLPVCQCITIFENSMRQSDEALLNRGRRYQKFQAQMEAAGGGPGSETRYLNAAHVPDDEIALLPQNLINLIL